MPRGGAAGGRAAPAGRGPAEPGGGAARWRRRALLPAVGVAAAVCLRGGLPARRPGRGCDAFLAGARPASCGGRHDGLRDVALRALDELARGRDDFDELARGRGDDDDGAARRRPVAGQGGADRPDRAALGGSGPQWLGQAVRSKVLEVLDEGRQDLPQLRAKDLDRGGQLKDLSIEQLEERLAATVGRRGAGIAGRQAAQRRPAHVRRPPERQGGRAPWRGGGAPGAGQGAAVQDSRGGAPDVLGGPPPGAPPSLLPPQDVSIEDTQPKIFRRLKEAVVPLRRSRTKPGFEGWLMPTSKKPLHPHTDEVKAQRRLLPGKEYLLSEELARMQAGLPIQPESKFAKVHRVAQRNYQPLPWDTVQGSASCITDPSDLSWKDLGLDSPEAEQLVDVMARVGIYGPNRLQETMVPGILEGKDTLLSAQTGSGKTLTFLAPILSKHVLPLARQDLARRFDPLIPTHLLPKVLAKPRVLIVSPTKELAAQIWRVARDLLSPFPQLNTTLLIGGNSHAKQDEALKFDRPVVVVGTPGRILDHCEEGRLVFEALKVVVFDEVDALFTSLSRKDHLQMLVERTMEGTEAQKILASATGATSEELAEFAEQHLRKPWLDSPWLGVEMPLGVLHLANGAPDIPKKLKFLQRLTSSIEPEPTGILVFCNNVERVRKVLQELRRMGIPSQALTGNRSAAERVDAIKNLGKGVIEVIVCTDVASRGLDFKELSHVVNFEMPPDAHAYAHRAGRVGRAGKSGIVISLGGGGSENNRLTNYANELGITVHECNVDSGLLQVYDPREDPHNGRHVKDFFDSLEQKKQWTA